MKDLNKSKYTIIVIKRKLKVKTTQSRVFDLVLTIKSKHNKFFVIEKLGSFDFDFNKITINFFRLIY